MAGVWGLFAGEARTQRIWSCAHCPSCYRESYTTDWDIPISSTIG